MKVLHEDFIGIYDDVFSEEYCDKLIKHYEWCKENNRTWDRTEEELYKKDNACSLSIPIDDITFSHESLSGLIDEFNTNFWDICYKDYRSVYSVLNNHDKHTIFSYKIQKTMPAGGYHIWHCENGERNFSHRLGTYILYLNDVEVGGETEFLYLSKRVESKKGRLVIFPANYPWAHRGNPPLSGEKYIMTGWIEFC